jgi:hypothetical protein
MATPIKSTPELTGKAAQDFIIVMNKLKPSSIDFSKQMKSMRAIIRKSQQMIDTDLI